MQVLLVPVELVNNIQFQEQQHTMLVEEVVLKRIIHQKPLVGWVVVGLVAVMVYLVLIIMLECLEQQTLAVEVEVVGELITQQAQEVQELL